MALMSLVIVMLIPLSMSAQHGFEDVVYLKNGSVIRGMIVEQVPNVSIKIQTHDRNIFVFQMAEIDRIAKEELVRTKRVRSIESSATELCMSIQIGLSSPIADFGRKEFENKRSMYGKDGGQYVFQVDYWPARRFGVIGALSLQVNTFDSDAYSSDLVANYAPYYSSIKELSSPVYRSTQASLGVVFGLVKGEAWPR